MSPALWMSLVAAYPFAVALIIIWVQGATRLPTPDPAGPRRPTLKVEAFGREVARFEILEHVTADGEVLEFHVPLDVGLDWTVDEVADAIAAIDALPQAPELETL